MSKGIFITGTGTDIGKTYVTALIVKKLVDEGLKSTYYKSALSGADIIDNKIVPGDAKYVCDIAGLKNDPNSLVSYIYKRAVSPHLATKYEGNPLDLNKVLDDFNSLKKENDYIVVEGSGGIICPIVYEENKKIMLEDIIKKLNLDTILIADAGLGTINQIVLTAEYMKSKNINIKGIILNNFIEDDYMHIDNKKMVEDMLNIPVIATVKENDSELLISKEDLINLFKEV